MANKPLKSIKFPGLEDTYIIPEVDNSLSITGAAADSKVTGDEISNLKNLVGTTSVAEQIQEAIGDIEVGGGGVGQATEQGGEIFNDYENNAANGSYDQAAGYHSQASSLALKLTVSNISGDIISFTYDESTTDLTRQKIYNYIINAENANMPAKIIAHLPGDGEADHACFVAVASNSVKNRIAVRQTDDETFYNKFTPTVGMTIYAWLPKRPEFNDFQDDYAQPAYAALAHGYQTQASGKGAVAVGTGTTASGHSSFASGAHTYAGVGAHSEGAYTQAAGQNSHAEGRESIASGTTSHAEGHGTTASGVMSHAEGHSTVASARSAHAEGENTTASDYYAHAEGYGTTASKPMAHAEGENTTASARSAHAEGNTTTASGQQAHAEGYSTNASGANSHAEGRMTTASGSGAHAEGNNTIAAGNYQHVEGKYNVEDTDNTYAHIIGGGNSSERKNIFTVDWDGNLEVAGTITDGNGNVLGTGGEGGSGFNPEEVSTSTQLPVLFLNGDNAAYNSRIKVNSNSGILYTYTLDCTLADCGVVDTRAIRVYKSSSSNTIGYGQAGQVLMTNGSSKSYWADLPTGGSGAIEWVEDSTYPGCYYHMVDGEKEWLNPPMVFDQEYRLMSRSKGYILYTKIYDMGLVEDGIGSSILGEAIPDFIWENGDEHKMITDVKTWIGRIGDFVAECSIGGIEIDDGGYATIYYDKTKNYSEYAKYNWYFQPVYYYDERVE